MEKLHHWGIRILDTTHQLKDTLWNLDARQEVGVDSLDTPSPKLLHRAMHKAAGKKSGRSAYPCRAVSDSSCPTLTEGVGIMHLSFFGK